MWPVDRHRQALKGAMPSSNQSSALIRFSRHSDYAQNKMWKKFAPDEWKQEAREEYGNSISMLPDNFQSSFPSHPRVMKNVFANVNIMDEESIPAEDSNE